MNPEELFKAARQKAADILKKADDEKRSPTDEELLEATKHLDEADTHKKHIDAANRAKALMGDLLGGDAEPEFTPDGVKSLGEHFVKHAGDLLRKTGSRFTAGAPEYKAATDVQVTGGQGGVLGPVLTSVDTSIVIGLRRRLTVEDLLGVETISGAAITYFVEGALEGDFTTVAEGGQKPQLHYANPTAVTEALSKIAGFIKESDELLEDLPFLASAINGRLLYQLALTAENQLLSGNGTGTNVRGILNRSGIQTEASADNTDNADAIFRAITKTATGSGLDADGIVINPVDYQALRLAKDGNKQYYGGGFFAGQYGNGGITEQPPLWGMRTVVTPAIAQGTVLVGSFAQAATAIVKGGVRVEATNSNEDDFENNRITVRAERRLALAVRVPAGFVKVTLSAAEPA